MPVWWGRKSHKDKEQQQQQQELPCSHSFNGDFMKNDKKKGKEKPKSFDEVSVTLKSRNSPRGSKEFSVSGFSGVDSEGEKKGHPLPRPSATSSAFLAGTDHGVGLGSGSVSVSSVSSSGSSDDPSPDHHALFGVHSAQGERKLSPRSRSPVPGSCVSTVPTSPLHPRLSGAGLESPTGRSEDGRNQYHPLPLPPSSPTRPSSFRATMTENSQCLRSIWKKGRLLGRGTFGHVFVGFNSESGQMCAIKEVKVISDDPSSKECLKQLDQEMKLLSQLSHPNIVQYYGSKLGEDNLSLYLEYVSGGSIHKLLQEYGPFNEPVIQNYTTQILYGLAYLHGRNTLHRDIKGANILVGTNGEIKLADFGMAKHITSCSSMLSFKGSPYWMAPEVIMNTSGYNLAVDIWSLGCTVLEMATSKPPWSQYEGVAAIFKIGNSKDMPEIPDHLSDDAKSFVKLCLQRDPVARPTAIQLLDHPFIRDQVTKKVEKSNIINNGLPVSINGGHRKAVSEIHSNRTGVTSCAADYVMKSKVTCSRVLCSRDSVRTITSLPVSPCSSPLQQNLPAHRSCFLSPPHPSYTSMGQSGYGFNNYSPLSTWPNANYPANLLRDVPQLKVRTPGRSPRARLI